ncbi:MAG TPA: protein kinase [Polyangiaceae bacterium]
MTSNLPLEPGDDTAEAAVRVGRTLRDKWHLDALIDVGGMAAVYAATHRNGMRGAVKILHRHRSLDPDIAARFRREGYIANKVAHPNAVSVLDDDVDDDGSVFLVMELLEGATLRERLETRGGTLPADEVLLAMDQLLDVLAVAHEAGIIHRDVKPENVFVTTGGNVKILDFGIARLCEPSAAGHSATMAGLPMGSPAFMSPEQARGRWDLVDAQSDVWSVGATMFTLLSGQDVHTAGTVPELLATIFTQPAPSLATVVPDAPPAVVELVDRALQLRLADRWPDARAMQAAARAAYAASYGEPIPEPAPAASRTPRPPSPSDPSVSPSQLRIRGATTVVASDTTQSRRAVRQRRVQRTALGLAILVAAVLGIAGAEGDVRSDDAVVAGDLVAEVGEAPSPLPVRPTPAPVSLPAQDVPRPTAPRPPLASPATPVVRIRRPSIYDRRY